MKKYLFTVILITSITKTVWTQQAQKSDEDFAWNYIEKPIYGVSSDLTALARWGDFSSKYLCWKELFKRQYRDRGTVFFEKFPNDPHFKEWLLKTVFDAVPAYWKNPEQGALESSNYLAKGSVLAPVIDIQAENDWIPHYLLFRTRYLEAKATTQKEKVDFKGQELQYNIWRLAEKIYLSKGNLDAILISEKPLINSYCIQALNMANDSIPEVHPLKSLSGAFGGHDPQMDKAILECMKLSKDSGTIIQALDRESMLKRFKEKRPALKLPSLGGGAVIDLDKLRGKVVMVEFWTINCGSCIVHMPKFERIYKQYHKDGFEMLSVCLIGADAKDDGSSVRKKAIELQKKKGVTYLSAEFNPGLDKDRGLDWDNPIWSSWDNASGGGVFLFDKQGNLVSRDQTGQWMEFEVRKLLGLPLDQTGKQ